MTILIIILVILVFGLACLTLIPALPIVPAQFLIILIFGSLTSFSVISGWEVVIFGFLAALSLIVDYSAGAVGARLGGAHRWSILSGVIGGIFGSILLPPFGGFIGIPLFVSISELMIKRSPKKLMHTASFSFLGAVAGVMLNGFLAFTTAVLFLIFVF
ncbi:DUF456 domain-containing protein [Candidatus Parcubacteria bacterium]|nr:DUF456 domain-containing protein [Candidatus Parcubacteria bacterium]